MSNLLGVYGDQLIVLEPHVGGDVFETPQTVARASWYGVSGIPHVRIDGKYSVVGAGSCSSAQSQYNSRIQSRLSETGGLSPIDVTGFFAIDGTSGSLQATFEVLDPGTYTNLRATVWLYEDDIFWCCGYGGANTWNETVRVLETEIFDLGGPGDSHTMVKEIQIDPSWDTAELHAVAVIQYNGADKAVIQGARLQQVTDFSFDFPVRVASVPEGNGEALFQGTIENVSGAADLFTLSVGEAAVWTTEFQVEGDPTWYTTTDLNLAPGETRDVTVRVLTDDTVMIGTGSLEVEAQSTGRVQPASFRTFNGSYAILLVDDDGTNSYEQKLVDGLDALGYLYEDWDAAGAHNSQGPRQRDLLGFDAVVWHTAYQSGDLLSDDDLAGLTAYLDDGGALYLSSLDFTSGLSTAGQTFLADYLGVGAFTLNRQSDVANGVGGDPITDGMSQVLTWPAPVANRTDRLDANALGTSIFINEDGHPVAVRAELGNGTRTVFSTIPHAVYSVSDPDPNNSEELLRTTLDWLLDRSTTDAPTPGALAGGARLLGASPNPFHGGTEIAFYLDARSAAEGITLEVVDASGRLVRSLAQGRLEPGRHSIRWDGRDDRGREVNSGIYFTKLRAGSSESGEKVVVLR